MEKRTWFLSYAYRLVAVPNELHYGSTVRHTEEHPIVTIERWNREIDYRKHVLLYWCELTLAPGVELPILDVEI